MKQRRGTKSNPYTGTIRGGEPANTSAEQDPHVPVEPTSPLTAIAPGRFAQWQRDGQLQDPSR